MSELAAESGVEPVEPQVEEPAAEVEAPEVAEEPAAPAAELPFDPAELQAELEYSRSQNEQLYGMLEQFVNQQQGGQQAQPQAGVDLSQLTDEYGNLSPQGLAALLESNNQRLLGTINQQLQAIQAPIAQQQEAQVVAEGNQRLQDIIADDIARNGDFASDPEADAQAREMVTTLAATMFPDLSQRYGPNPRTAELAMTRAAEQVRGLLRSAGVAAVSQTANQLATLAGAPQGEPGSGVAGTEAPVIRKGERSVDRFAGTFGGQ